MKILEVEDIIKDNLDMYCRCSCKGKDKNRTIRERLLTSDFYYEQNVAISFDIVYNKKKGFADYGKHYIQEAEDGGDLVCDSCRESIFILEEEDD